VTINDKSLSCIQGKKQIVTIWSLLNLVQTDWERIFGSVF